MAQVASSGSSASESAAEPEFLEGSEAIARAMISAGCRFFAGYPMTPFTEVLEAMAKHLPAQGGSCVNAESELEAVGMAWGAAATGTPAATGSTGQGLSLMQESLAEITYARLPLVVLNMARAQGDYFQATRGGGHGDYRHIVLAPKDVTEAVYLVQEAFHLAAIWRNPVLVMGDYYIAHTWQSVSTARIDFGPEPDRNWALDGATGGTGKAKLISPIADTKRGDDVGYDLAEFYGRRGAELDLMGREVQPRAETGFLEGADLVVVAYGTVAQYVREAVANLRADGAKVGYIRPITLYPFPTEVLRHAASSAKAFAVYENNRGQMIEDVMLSVMERADVRFIGGLSVDSSGFGIAPDLDVTSVRARIQTTLEEIS